MGEPLTVVQQTLESFGGHVFNVLHIILLYSVVLKEQSETAEKVLAGQSCWLEIRDNASLSKYYNELTCLKGSLFSAEMLLVIFPNPLSQIFLFFLLLFSVLSLQQFVLPAATAL